jgi:ATP-binding cassette subfamily B protein
MIAGKCAVLITHRLSAVQLADKVAVFDDGHVAEYGTHTELYAKGGIYTEMFDKQAQFYRNNPTGDDASE